MKKIWPFLLPILAGLGIADSGYLTLEHFGQIITPCRVGAFWDCGKVLGSVYSEIFGVPLALLGLLFYIVIFLVSIYTLLSHKRLWRNVLVIATVGGFLFSIYLVYLQLVLIKSICLFCMGSAITSTLLFIITQTVFFQERKRLLTKTTNLGYRALRSAIFLTSSDKIHKSATSIGNALGKSKLAKAPLNYAYQFKDSAIEQKVAGINFPNPVGLAAGFDYEGKLTQINSAIGFGWQTVGTVTNMKYEGNPPPRLGRLPHSKSLMVNKGFKSSGVKNVSQSLKGLDFEIPTGISVGRTNSSKLKTQKQSIDDIMQAFKALESKKLRHSYYELNISCPNLIHDVGITFYPPKNLKELLVKLDKLKLKKPVFVKMPITESDKDVLSMLKVISKHSPVGVIFGNLQKDRNHKAFVKREVKKFKTGNFSGKPTWERSNELIKLAYKNYKNSLIIVGCGGIFSGNDAYTKIKLGASLVQFITGMIFEGPQLAAQINQEMVDLLKKDGFDNISQAVGVNN